MSQAHQFKSHVAEFLSGASIEKPHSAAASGVSGAAGAAVPSAPPVDDDCNGVLAPPTRAPACATSAPPVVHPSFSLSLSDIPTLFTDQFNPKPATLAPPPPPQPHSPPRTQVLHHGAAAGPGFRRRWIHVHPSPPCPPLLLSPLQLRPRSPPPSRYERSSMQQWLALGHNTSPKSGALLPSTALVPNHDLRARVQEGVQVGGGVIGDA